MAEPANRHTNAAGGKYYIHPTTDERFDSVTTILDVFDKDGLKIWAAGLAADMAFEHVPQLLQSIIVPDCNNTYNRCYQKHGRDGRCERCPCGECQPCWHRRLKFKHSAESARRAQEGTECHEAINHWIVSGGGAVSLRDEVKPYFESFLRWTKDYGLLPRDSGLGASSWEQTEVTLLNRELMYAGTSDAAVWLRRGTRLADAVLDQLGGVPEALVRVDYKTREKPDERLYNDMPLQGVAYEHCDVALLPDGSEFPAPKTAARSVLQLRPNDYTFKLMLSDEGTFQAFVGTLVAYRWMNGPGKKAFDPALIVPDPVVGRYSEFVSADETVPLPPADPWDELPSLPTPPPPPPQAPSLPDPWTAHNHPSQVAADSGGDSRSPTPLDKLLGIDPGKLDASRLNEPLPF